MSTPDSKRTSTRIVVGIVGTLLLGAVGSGLWERLVGPFTDWLLHRLVVGSGHMTQAYLDHIYAHVGFGLHEHASYLPELTVEVAAVVFSIAVIVLLIHHRRRSRLGTPGSSEIGTKPFRDYTLNPIVFWLALLLSSLNALSYTEGIFASSYQESTVIWLERSFEILRPCVPESRYYSLRAA